MRHKRKFRDNFDSLANSKAEIDKVKQEDFLLLDHSPKVFQRSKIRETFTIRDLQWTPKQLEFINLAVHNKDVKVLLVNGPAGTAKTILSVYCSLQLINTKKISDIIYLRSAVESSDKAIGFLPGTIQDKMHFYNLPFIDKLEELLSKNDIIKLQKEERISIFPVNFCRGMSWNAKSIILDEAQNSTIKEIITVLTRIGKFSKCFVLADPLQTDLNNGKRGAFEQVFNLFSDDESKKFGIYTFQFGNEDILRSDLVKFLVKKFNNLNKIVT